MPTNLDLDDALVAEAKRLGKHKTKCEAVNQALMEHVARRKRHSVVDLFGRVDWDSDYEYKAGRRRRG